MLSIKFSLKTTPVFRRQLTDFIYKGSSMVKQVKPNRTLRILVAGCFATGMLGSVSAYAICTPTISNGSPVTSQVTTSATGQCIVNTSAINVAATGTSVYAIYVTNTGNNATIYNTGTITARTIAGPYISAGILDSAAGANITNTSTGSITAGGTVAGGNGIFAQGAGSTVTNEGAITLIAPDPSSNFVAGITIQGANSSITNTSTGAITLTGRNAGLRAWGGSTGATIVNAGAINLSNGGSGNSALTSNWDPMPSGIYFDTATSGTASNTGTISISGVSYLAGAYNAGALSTLSNSGTMTVTASTGDAYGVWNNDAGTITELTNTGTISATGTNSYGIFNAPTATITTLNNAQGAGNAAGALTYSGKLPTNYSIIISSSSSFGRLAVSNATGSTAFSIYTGSTVSNNTKYSSVITGLGASSITNTSGSYGGYSWTLGLASGATDIWDLIFGSPPPPGPTAADTQASLNALAPKLRGAFSSQIVATNFANMNTYDCNLFDAKGLCISVGGQQTYVDSPSSNITSTVVVAGYKVSPTFRIGGFLNQNVNSNTGSNVDVSNKSPLMGLFAVWNQNENHLGYQIKLANAYQDKDVTTIREEIASSEAGKGKTELNTQSYVGELSYAFLANQEKTLVRPYAAVRYTRIKQDGYTEDATVSAPLTYASLTDRSTAALVGVKLNHKLAGKVNLTGSLGVEQDLNHDVDDLTASGVSGLTSENFNNNIKRTRPVASIGAYYMPVKNQRIAADIYYQQLPFQSTASTTAYVNYTIGF